MARKKAKRSIKRRVRRAKRRSGITVSELGRARRRRPAARKRRGFGAITSSGGGLDTWRRAATASIILRILQGGAKWGIAKAGINFPSLSMAVPAVIAVAASRKMIDIPGLFPMAVDQTVNAIIDRFPALKKAFDFDFGDAKPVKGYSQTLGAITPRSYRDTMRAIEARNGWSTGEPPSYSGISISDKPTTYSGYSQIEK